MGKISRIQLRGISRTPSDRMTEDGGCAESLNVSLDHSELAPSFIPEDVTKELGLPDNLQAEKVFVHKTANYEHYVAQFENKVIAYADGKSHLLATLSFGESVNDINAVGNIVIIATSESVYYVLWKATEYVYIGNQLPVPAIQIEVVGNNDETFFGKDGGGVRIPGADGSIPGMTAIASFEKGAWEEAARGVAENEDVNAAFQEMTSNFWASVQQLKNKIGKWGHFSCPRLVRYAIKLYDGSYVYHSAPILIGAGEKEWLTAASGPVMPDGTRLRLTYSINLFYRAIAKLVSWEVEGWEDIIEGVDIFISTDIAFPNINESFATCDNGGGKVYFKGYDEAFEKTKEEVLSKVLFYKIESIAVRDLDSLKAGIDLHRQDFVEQAEDLVVQERLTPDYMTSHKVIPRTMELYNNSLLVNAAKIEMPNPYPLLNGLFCNSRLDAVYDNFQEPKTYQMKFRMRRNNGEEYSIMARNPQGGFDLVTPLISNGAPSALEKHWYARPMAWISYPDVNCYQVDLFTGGGDVVQIPMSQHPGLSVSYAFVGLDEFIEDGTAAGDMEYDFSEKKTYEVTNQVMMSEMNNPFIFPAGKRNTLQSSILGVAIATTALSQGQFGQFPLYVFTEDGIWAMETAADGSFVTSKPLSRDVCVNPDSITSIDNAVIFVTDKGVMLLQGSQVVNISPNMNGRHYTIEETAKVILEKTIEDTIAKIGKTPVDQMAQVIQNEVGQSISQQETRASIERTAQSIIAEEEFFKDLLPILSDSTHFMAFVREATIAYDYPGQRLVFIKKDEKYQYVYKMDTQTWHKTAYGIDLLAPINSYPECMVQGQKKKEVTRTFWKVVEYNSQEEFDYLAGRIRVKMPELSDREIQSFLDMDGVIDVTGIHEDDREWLANEMDTYYVATEFEEKTGEESFTCIYDLSTILDAADSRIPTRGVIATRPFDLGAPDVLKTITDIKIRGQYARGAVKFMLLGSMDGINFYVIGTKRGKAWKLFRLIILADLDPTERISWVDVTYDEKFTNRLR